MVGAEIAGRAQLGLGFGEQGFGLGEQIGCRGPVVERRTSGVGLGFGGVIVGHAVVGRSVVGDLARGRDAVAHVGVETGEQRRERVAERLRVHRLLVVGDDHEPVLGDDRDLAALLLQLDVERPDEHQPVADRDELHVAEADLGAALLVVLE